MVRRESIKWLPFGSKGALSDLNGILLSDRSWAPNSEIGKQSESVWVSREGWSLEAALGRLFKANNILFFNLVLVTWKYSNDK